MPKKPTKNMEENDSSYTAEEAMERMNRALRGARIAGPKPLKEKPKIKGKRSASKSSG